MIEGVSILVKDMTLNIGLVNQILTDFEFGGEISETNLNFLENTVFSGELHGISKCGLPLFGMRAKTQLFESNFYLLESIRLLALQGRKDRLQAVIGDTLTFLRGKCYGQFCPTGECFETSACVLRFLRAVCPAETEWIARMEEGIRTHCADKVRTKAVRRYIARALGKTG